MKLYPTYKHSDCTSYSKDRVWCINDRMHIFSYKYRRGYLIWATSLSIKSMSLAIENGIYIRGNR